jgi:hypothetical protein
LLEFDKSRLMQVVTNLVSNAIKFTPAQGHVEISAKWVWSCGYNDGICATCDKREPRPTVEQPLSPFNGPHPRRVLLKKLGSVGKNGERG